MRSEASAAGVRPENIRAQSLLSDGGTVEFGACRVQRKGHSKYGLLPQPFANMMGVEANQEVNVYVNLEHGLIIHQIPDSDDGE